MEAPSGGLLADAVQFARKRFKFRLMFVQDRSV